MGGAGVGSLTVDGAGGGGDDAADGEAPAIGDEEFEEEGSAADVGALIAGDLVHGLAGAGLCGEVEDSVGCLKRGDEDLGVGDVAAEETEVRCEIGRGAGEAGKQGREFRGWAVNLTGKIVEDADGVAAVEQGAGGVGTDESGAAGDENIHAGREGCEMMIPERGGVE